MKLTLLQVLESTFGIGLEIDSSCRSCFLVDASWRATGLSWIPPYSDGMQYMVSYRAEYGQL